ncbi:hypothetical protein, partial [Flavobacterium branchiophilum]|uniref:hypothetical protein n=1 Tax=Flavobacterium branchiophilum TaxID=55197 RepID=UPI0039F0D6B2
IESRRGISPQRSHRTVLEMKFDVVKVSLHTALHSIKSHKYKYIYGCTNNQCKNKLVIGCDFVS